MSSPLRDPKELTEWLELDYHRRPRGLRRWTRHLTWAAFGAAGLATLCVLWPWNHAVFEGGPVSTAHTMFNDNCAACHTEPFQTAARLWPFAHHARSTPNQTCKSCHDEPAHNTLVLNTRTEPDCASCHQEHRGRPELARVRDDHCTACHADLDRRYPGQTDGRVVTAFTERGHPPFRWWDGHNDPGTVRFNHHKHLNPDGVLKLDREQLKHQWLAGDAPNGPTDHPAPARVRLRCDDCHRADESGRSMKPINFEQHCQECHPLAVQVSGKLPGEALRREAAAFALTPAPHREPEVVRAVLRDRYAELARRFKHDLFQLPAAPQPEEPPALPWRPVSPPQSKQEWDWTQTQLQTAERVLFTREGGCQYCHQVKQPWRPGEGQGPDVLPQITPAQINKRSFAKIGESDHWLPQSRFNHHAHRILNCTECHKAETSERTSDVLIPTINNCLTCHNPLLGARSDCAECHPYHPRGGAHAAPRRGERTISDIIQLGRP